MLEVHAIIDTKLDLEEVDFLSVEINIEDDYKLPNVLRGSLWNFVNTDDLEPMPSKYGFNLIPSQRIKFFECNGNIYKRVNGDLIQFISRNGETKNMRLNEILILNPNFPKEENLDILIHRKQTYQYTPCDYASVNTSLFFGAMKHFTKKMSETKEIKKTKKLFKEYFGK